MRLMTRFLLGAALMASVPAAATAQTMAPTMEPSRFSITPFVGMTFGGDTTSTGSSVGVAATWMSRSWWGVEAELADSPDLFEQTGFLTSRRATTLMGNFVVAMPTEMRLKPYVSGGLGLLHVNLTEAGGLAAVDANRLGMNVGGGAWMSINDHTGARLDVRYFQGLMESDDDLTNPLGLNVSSFGFLRLAGGLVIRF